MSNLESVAENVRLKKQLIVLKKELSDTTTAYEKLRLDCMKESREIIRLKNKLSLVSDRETSGVGDSLDIYLPITPRVIGSDDRSGGGGDREGILRRRIALLETDLAAANSARRARIIPSRSGTPPTPRGGSIGGGVSGGRDSDRERERERSRVKKMTRERSDSGYGSGGGYGSSRSTAANGYGRPGSSFSQLAPATIAKARDRERERERSLSRGGSSSYMRYGTVLLHVCDIFLPSYHLPARILVGEEAPHRLNNLKRKGSKYL